MNMKRHCRVIKKIIWMKWKLLAFTKSVKHPKKSTKTPEFVDTDPDDTDDEQEPAVKKHKK